MPLIDATATSVNSISAAGAGVWLGFDMDSETASIDGAKAIAPYATDDVFLIQPLDGNKATISDDDSVFNSSSSTTSTSSVEKEAGEDIQEEEDAYNYVFANKVRSNGYLPPHCFESRLILSGKFSHQDMLSKLVSPLHIVGECFELVGQ